MRNEFDRIVIGGGAAGLFAAGWAAKSGLRVLVLEKRERPARKILVTGKGRCNVTNHCSPQEFIAAVRRNPRFLMSAVYAMTPQDAMACFEGLGVPLKTERGNRVFPVSDRAMDIADALVRFARQGGVQIKQATVSELIQRDDAVVGVKTEAGEEFFAPLTILATGGKSYPGTGSDGSGYALAAAVGHTIIPPRPSLVPIICENTDKQFTTLMGLSLRNVSLSTCGLVPKIDQLATEKLPITLCLSLHAPNDEIRRQIMPISRKYSIAETVSAMKRYEQVTSRRVAFEYTLIHSLNDTPAHARELAHLTKGIRKHINLIPLNRGVGTFRPPSPQRVQAFLKTLTDLGVSATVRRRQGDDVAGACGQLRLQRQREEQTP